MKDWAFSQEDRLQIEAMGMSEAQVRFQMEMFHKASPYVHLHRPCVLGDGIQHFPPEELNRYVQLQEAAAGQGRFIKFAPASGAATRMFQTLSRIYHQEIDFQAGEILEVDGSLRISRHPSGRRSSWIQTAWSVATLG